MTSKKYEELEDVLVKISSAKNDLEDLFLDMGLFFIYEMLEDPTEKKNSFKRAFNNARRILDNLTEVSNVIERSLES